MGRFILSAFADEASSKLEKQIAALQRNGIGYIEPRNISGCLTKKTDEELTEIAQTLSAAGIRVSSLGSPIGKIGIDDDFGLIVRYEDGCVAHLSSGEVVLCGDGGASAVQSARASVHLS